jgi:hypothetical protein
MLRRLSFAAIAFIASLPLAGHASAACVQADLLGRWHAYALTSERGGQSYWWHCQVEFTDQGALAMGNCEAPRHPNARLASGALTLADPATCAFQGDFVWEGSSAHVDHAKLSPEKKVMSGVGSTELSYFQFTMIKVAAP